MRKILFITALLVISRCYSIEYQGYQLESEHVHFEEDEMVFEGPLSLTSEEGKILANRAIVKVLNKRKFQHITLEGDVSIEKKGQFLAKSQRATMDDQTISLYEGISLDFNDYGQLKTTDAIHLIKDTKGEIGTIRCLGNTTYRCEDEEKDRDLTFLGEGEIEVDRELRLLKFFPDKDHQLYFRDHLVKVYSNHALVHYDIVEGQAKTQLIDLEGDVRFVNRGGAIVQCALADQVTYRCETEQMYFKALKHNRVLFYDKVNNLQVSAPEILVWRNQETRKQEVQGIGDVRFHFSEKEYEQFVNWKTKAF